MHALTVLTVLTTLLILSTTNLASTHPLPLPLAPLEPELRALAAAGGFNTTISTTIHHVFHTLNLLSTPERVALTTTRQLVALNYSIDPDTALCHWLSRNHRDVIANTSSYGGSLAVQNATSAESGTSVENGTSVDNSTFAENSTSTTTAVAATAAEITNDNSTTLQVQHTELAFDYEACTRFMASGMRGARLLAHRLQAMQKENMALVTEPHAQPVSVIEERKTKFWIWHNGFSLFVCRFFPSWCHEEEDW